MKAFASCYISEKLSEKSGIQVFALKPYSRLDAPVNTHADMLVFIIDKTVFCYDDYYNCNREVFDETLKYGYKIVPIKKECKSKYPDDVSLNALIMGKTIFANVKYIADEISAYAKNNNYKIR